MINTTIKITHKQTPNIKVCTICNGNVSNGSVSYTHLSSYEAPLTWSKTTNGPLISFNPTYCRDITNNLLRYRFNCFIDIMIICIQLINIIIRDIIFHFNNLIKNTRIHNSSYNFTLINRFFTTLI